MEEKIFFSLEGVKVSNMQFIANEHSYRLRDIISVRHGLLEPARGFATFCMLTGAFLFIFQGAFMFVGGFSIAMGIAAWLSAKTRYAVIIQTADGEHQALISENSEDINRVITALHRAMIESS